VWVAEYSNLGYIVFGGGTNCCVYRMDAAGTVTTMPSAPFGKLNIGTGVECCSVTRDPVTGYLIIIDQQRRVWQFNPLGAGQWTNTGLIAPARFAQNVGIGESLISAPIPDYGVMMYVKCDDTSACWVYLYKHSAGTSPAAATTPRTSP
jgi:hypothetical protein